MSQKTWNIEVRISRNLLLPELEPLGYKLKVNHLNVTIYYKKVSNIVKEGLIDEALKILQPYLTFEISITPNYYPDLYQ